MTLERFYILSVGDQRGETAQGPYTNAEADLAVMAEPSHKIVTLEQLTALRKRPLLVDLKPCPFVHNGDVDAAEYPPRIVEDRGEYGGGALFFVRCWVCEALGPVAHTAEEAAALWNRREG